MRSRFPSRTPRSGDIAWRGPSWVRAAILFLLFAWLAVAAPAPASRPTNLVLVIGDGMGPAYLTLARDFQERPLTLDSLLVGASSTASSDSRVTDSGAAATALACGIRTVNSAIGVDPQGRPRRTILEAAEARGMATGLVATSRITHATPAAFAAHVHDRSDEDSIAVQMLAHGIEVLLGGGERHFRPLVNGGRSDRRDLLQAAEKRGVHVVTRLEALDDTRPPLVGLFSPSHLSYVIDRDTTVEPTLDRMTRAALARLSSSRRGFFLMVEGSRIDHAGHVNDPATAAREVLELDAAVRAILEFARRDGRTLVVVTADHETGGLSLGREVDGTSYYEWHPEVLRRVKRSASVMAGRIAAGQDPRAVLTADGGLDSLSENEVSTLRGARPQDLEVEVAHLLSRRARVGWTTLGHTAVDVPVCAWGPGSERLRGFHTSDQLGRDLARQLGLEVGGLAAR
jgi:alkaline phosphatase